jgi:hypothetical protein
LEKRVPKKKAKRSPRLFKAFTNKPEKPKEKEDPQKTVGLREKNIGD